MKAPAKRVVSQNCSAKGRRAGGDANFVVGGNMGGLEVRLNDPGIRIVCVDQVINLRIVLEQWRPERIFVGAPGVAAAEKDKRVGTVQGVGGGAGDPIVNARIKAVGE